jgi:hypothetical protein
LSVRDFAIALHLMIAVESSNRQQICKRLRGPFTNKFRSAGSGWIHQLFQPRHGRGSLEGATMTAKPIYGRVRTGLLFINLHNDFLSEGGKLWPRVATNSEPHEGQPHKEAIMYGKNSPQRRPTSAKLRRLFAISVSSLALLPMDTASAQTGASWGQMSSLGYKQMKEEQVALRDYDKDFKPIDLYNPLTGKYDHKFTALKSFYRTPTLVSIWATAPYLHNNSVGEYNGDPSIAGRMAAFQDGMSKLLWPERRQGLASIKVTTEDSKLPDLFPLLKTLDPELAAFDFDPELLRAPKGTPINLITNVHPKDAKSVLMAYVNGVLDGRPKEEFNKLQTINRGKGQAAMLKRLLEVSTCPDFIEDKGHYYGHDMSDEDKRALIEYVKYF